MSVDNDKQTSAVVTDCTPQSAGAASKGEITLGQILGAFRAHSSGTILPHQKWPSSSSTTSSPTLPSNPRHIYDGGVGHSSSSHSHGSHSHGSHSHGSSIPNASNSSRK